MAVVELVKNAYDADARSVTVTLSGLKADEGATIAIVDDGIGMSLDCVLNSWLEPATPHKRRGGRKERTALGRFPLGEKGVGRFAADKLGAEMVLVTRGRCEEGEVSLSVDWDRFGDVGYLDEIETEWQVRPPQRFRGKHHGTVIEVTGLRGTWSGDRVMRLREGLARLVSPFQPMPDFQILVDCPDYPECSGPVTNDLVLLAPYRLVGAVDENGVLTTDQSESQRIDLVRLATAHFHKGHTDQGPSCGPFRIALFAWDLDAVNAHGAGLDRRLRSELRRTAGISLYRDGFRVWPYGLPGDDWLELNQRRVNNPTLRLSTNQLVGVIETSEEQNPDLRDRTSREGLVDSPALHDLKALLVAAISHLEEGRFAVRQVVEAPVKTEDDPILAMLQSLKAVPERQGGTARLLTEIAVAYRQQQEEQIARQQRLLTLAGTGLSARQVAFEINRTVGSTATALEIAHHRSSCGGSDTRESIEQYVGLLKAHLDLLREQLEVLELFYDDRDGLPDAPADVRAAVQDAAKVFAYRLREANLRLVIEPTEPVGALVPRQVLLQVLIHLIENALHWTAMKDRPVRPEIRVRPLADPPGFLFADNGPGIDEHLRARIFDLHFSRREDSRGLGLHIVRTLLEEHGGSIEVVDGAGMLDGATFRVQFGSAGTSRSARGRARTGQRGTG